MKLFLSLAFGVSLIAFNSTETVPRHNVFFPSNSSELSGSPARVVEAVYAKLPAGQQLRFGIIGPISNVHGLSEKNHITAERANSIVALLKRIVKEGDIFEIQDVTNPYRPKQVDMAASVPFELEILLTKAPGWIEPTFTSIDEYLPMPVQTFSIDPRKDNRLVGVQGTVINIPANTLALGNGNVPAQMTVELKEVYGAGQILNADLHTSSGGQMLETGGTIHLNAHTNGSKARVANGQAIDLEFPKNGTNADGMQLFNGRVDRSGNFDWVDNGPVVERVPIVREKFYINEQEVTKEEYERRMREWEERKAEAERQQREWEAEQARWEEEQKQRLENEKASANNDVALNAYLMSTTELGWINCDRFPELGEKTDIIVMVDTTLRPSVLMVFTDIKSVMDGQYDARSGTVTFSNIPVGKTVRLVGYSIKDNVPYMANTQVNTSPKLKKDLELKQTTKAAMESELAALN
jgi:hypothetical protein